MCTIVMAFEDPLGATTSSKNALLRTEDNDASSNLEENQEKKDECTASGPQGEETTPEQLYNPEESQPVVETTTEEQNSHLVNANSWCIAVVTIVICFLFFLYYCF